MTDPGSDDQGPPPTFRESFGEAMRKTGLGQVRPGEIPTGKSLLSAVGGARGLVESILPGLGFLVVFSLTKSVPLSVLIPLALALVFVVLRLVSRTPITQAFAGVAGIAISAVLALITGNAANNFLPGIFINAASVAVLILSLLVRWPLIGVIVGFLSNDGTEWRKDRAKAKVLTVATWLWVGLFGVRLLVEVPLYLSNKVEWLAGTKLLLGVPLYAALVWVTWLLVRAVYARSQAASEQG
jgi:Protein of unknown function (DUF3159)